MSGEQEGSVGRFSFRRGLGETPNVEVNRYGQTMVPKEGDTNESPDLPLDVRLDRDSALNARASILDSAPRVLQNMLNVLSEDDPTRNDIQRQLDELLKSDIASVEGQSECSEAIDVFVSDFAQAIMDIDEQVGNITFEQQPGDSLSEEMLSTPAVPPRRLSTTSSFNETRICGSCAKAITHVAKFCPECGASQVVNYCVACGYHFADSDKFCPECGTCREKK